MKSKSTSSTKKIKTDATEKIDQKKPEIIPEITDEVKVSELKTMPKKVNIPDMNKMLTSDFNMNAEYREEPQPQKKPQEESTLKVYQVNTIIEEAKVWGTIVQVTPWVNGTGYEVILCNKNGAFQHLSITREEIDLINQMIKKLKNP